MAHLRVVAAGGLLATYAALVVAGIPLLNATSDEHSHLPAGYSYLATGDLRLNAQHPPLVKMLCALPLLALHPKVDWSDPAWTATPPREWDFGRAFLYGNDADRLLLWGRLPVAALGVLLGFVTWRWARARFGEGAGLLALFLLAFSPNLIAHARFVTMDLPLACFSTAFLYVLWRYTRDGGRGRLVLAGLALGAALASKFSATILLPVLPVLTMLGASNGEGSRGRRVARGLGQAGAVAAIAAIVVWAAYLFPADPGFYLEGLRQVNRDHDPSRAYYLLGRFRVGGWWWYFLAAFLLKTPVVTLAALAVAAWVRLRDRAGRLVDDAFVVLPAVAYVGVTSAFADPLGVRYLLPAYPLAIVFASRIAPWLATVRWRRWVAGAAAVFYAGFALWIFPDELAFFNVGVGGPSQGWRYLDDSNLDWGQDLKRLRAYLDAHGIERVRLLYPWNGSPEYYGIRYDPVTPRDWYERPSPGVYAVSTVWLIRGLHEASVRGVPTDWLTRYRPADRVAYSFFIYRFGDIPPETRIPPR